MDIGRHNIKVDKEIKLDVDSAMLIIIANSGDEGNYYLFDLFVNCLSGYILFENLLQTLPRVDQEYCNSRRIWLSRELFIFIANSIIIILDNGLNSSEIE